MCGITGFVRFQGDRSTIDRMTDAVRHRGPDASGCYYNEQDRIALGHRRLSILDLSASANQPFHSANGRYIIIFNGEIYNYREIRKGLDIRPRTTSDTEILVEGYARIGKDIFRMANGMFALAIWDTQQKELILARDRIGIKPLFIERRGDGIAFASEIKSLLQIDRHRVNHPAIASYLYLGYCPAELTLFEGITKFPAGCYGKLKENGHWSVTPYWQAEKLVTKQPHHFDSVEDAKKAFRNILQDSVRYRMISDVPVGTFLSGGTDSSLITALAQELSDRPIQTFSIGFENAQFNESEYARRVAEHLGTDHHEFILTEQEAKELFNNILEVYDEPFADASAIPTQMVSRVTRQHVKVALSGDGGDELFMGYGSYRWARRLDNQAVAASRSLISAVLSTGNNRSKRAAHLFQWSTTARRKSHIFSQEQYFFTERELRRMLLPKVPLELGIKEQYQFARELDASEEQAYFDLVNYLKDMLLVKVDRASMAHSLEVRVPLLDHRVVQFALNLPKKWKVREGQEKYLLKQLLYDHLPPQIFDRPKWGFSIPLNEWLRTDLKYLIDDHLEDASVEAAGLVAPAAVKQLKKRFFAGETYLYNRIWVLLLLHKWYKETAH